MAGQGTVPIIHRMGSISAPAIHLHVLISHPPLACSHQPPDLHRPTHPKRRQRGSICVPARTPPHHPPSAVLPCPPSFLCMQQLAVLQTHGFMKWASRSGGLGGGRSRSRKRRRAACRGGDTRQTWASCMHKMGLGVENRAVVYFRLFHWQASAGRRSERRQGKPRREGWPRAVEGLAQRTGEQELSAAEAATGARWRAARPWRGLQC